MQINQIYGNLCLMYESLQAHSTLNSVELYKESFC